jgi:excisionase family DNA binding protein
MVDQIKSPEQATPALLDVRGVAVMLGCSSRHVQRLGDSGRMPPALRLGILVRWSKATIEQWIAEGCPPVRKGDVK